MRKKVGFWGRFKRRFFHEDNLNFDDLMLVINTFDGDMILDFSNTNVTRQNIKEIEDKFEDKKINFEQKKIRGFSFRRCRNIIGKCDGEKLEGFEDFIGDFGRATTFEQQHNKIEIEYLDISGFNLHKKDLNFLKDLPHLKRLRLNNCGLKKDDKFGFLSEMRHDTRDNLQDNMELIDVGRNDLSEGALDLICDMEKLEYLDVSGSKLNSEQAQSIGQMQSLDTLHARNCFNSTNIKDIHGLFLSKSIERLNISKNDLSIQSGKRPESEEKTEEEVEIESPRKKLIKKTFGPLIGAMSKLEVLDISECFIPRNELTKIIQVKRIIISRLDHERLLEKEKDRGMTLEGEYKRFLEGQNVEIIIKPDAQRTPPAPIEIPDKVIDAPEQEETKSEII